MSLLRFSPQLYQILRDLDVLDAEQINRDLLTIMDALNAEERRDHTCYVYNELAQEFHPTVDPHHENKGRFTFRQLVELTIYYLMLDLAFLYPDNPTVQQIPISAGLREILPALHREEAQRLLVGWTTAPAPQIYQQHTRQLVHEWSLLGHPVPSGDITTTGLAFLQTMVSN